MKIKGLEKDKLMKASFNSTLVKGLVYVLTDSLKCKPVAEP